MYIGQQPVVGRYIILDQISGGFNGTASGFTMSTAGGAQGVTPGLAQNVLLSLGGVIQQPGTDYTISGSGLTFTTPPVSGTTFFATVLGDAYAVGTPSDGTVTPASIASGYDFAFPNLNVTGVVTIASGTAASPSLTITGDLNTGLYSPGADQVAISTSGTGRLFVDASGRVGINDANPVYQLEVRNPVTPGESWIRTNTASATNDCGIRFAHANTNHFVIWHNGTSDYLAFFDNIASAERLRITSAGLVGVGTSSPQNKLTVDTDIGIYRSSSDPTLNFSVGGTISAPTKVYRLLIDDSDSDKFQLRDDATPRITVDGSGNVGIGTSSPSYPLDVIGDGGIASVAATNSTSGLISVIGRNSSGSVSAIGRIRSYPDGSGNTSQLAFETRNSSATMVEAMRIDSSQRVGIGTTSPGDTLDIGTGGVFFSDQAAASPFPEQKIKWSNDSTTANGFYISQGTDRNGKIWHEQGLDIQFATNNTERARIDSSGRLLVGTSSVGLSAAKLQLAGGDNTNHIEFLNTTASDIDGQRYSYIYFRGTQSGGEKSSLAFIGAVHDGSADDQKGRLIFHTNSGSNGDSPTERMRITNDGKLRIGMTNFGSDPSASVGGTQFKDENTGHIITAATTTTAVNHHLFFNPNGIIGSIKTTGSATSFNTASDYRLKENVVDIDDGIARVKQLQPRRFNFIADIDTIVDGFIAHEAQAVVPEAVSGTKDEVDENGDAVMQGIDQSKLVPLLTAALQEAIAKIETLEAKVAALEAA